MSLRTLHRSFTATSAALLLAVGAAGCAPKDEPPKITPKPQPSSSAAASDGGGDDTAAPASDGGGSEGSTDAAVDKSKLPPENRSLRAPDPKDYPGFYEETDEGEVATLHYFVDAMYYLEATGDPSAVNLVTDDSQCSACVEARDSAVEATSSGNYKSQRRAQILSTDYVRTDEEAGVYLEYTVTPGAVLTGDNAGQEIEGAQFATVSSATWSDGHWKLTAIASRRLDR